MSKNSRDYQSSDAIYRPADGESYELPEGLVSAHVDPSLWAYSTLPQGDYDDLVSVHVITQGNYQGGDIVRQRMWLHDILDDEGIPYQVVIKGYWPHRRKYAEDQFIYVEEKNRKKAKRLKKEFLNPDNASSEPIGDEISDVRIVDGIPQRKCSFCGKEIDFDFHKCPFCKK